MSTGQYHLLKDALYQIRKLHLMLADRDPAYSAAEGKEMQNYICDLEKSVANIGAHVERLSDWHLIWPELTERSQATEAA